MDTYRQTNDRNLMKSSDHDLTFVSPARHFECHKQTKISLQTQHFNAISHSEIKELCWTAYFRLLIIHENTTGFVIHGAT